MPWSPGRYRLGLRLDTRREGYAHELTLRLPGAPALRVRDSDADAAGVIPAGSFEIGDVLELEFSEPRGGVALRGLVLTREGARGGMVDPELEERLRALGYVE
jgi:hypothetical protein